MRVGVRIYGWPAAVLAVQYWWYNYLYRGPLAGFRDLVIDVVAGAVVLHDGSACGVAGMCRPLEAEMQLLHVFRQAVKILSVRLGRIL